jgi:hypothetical protein
MLRKLKHTRGFFSYHLTLSKPGANNLGRFISSWNHLNIQVAMEKIILYVTFLAIFLVMANCNESQDENDETRAVRAAVKVNI